MKHIKSDKESKSSGNPFDDKDLSKWRPTAPKVEPKKPETPPSKPNPPKNPYSDAYGMTYGGSSNIGVRLI